LVGTIRPVVDILVRLEARAEKDPRLYLISRKALRTKTGHVPSIIEDVAMTQPLHAKIIDILSRCRDMTIATVRPDGGPQATVVSFVHDGLLIYFGCGADSQKARNIVSDRRVSIALTVPYENWLQIQGLSMAGTASEVTSVGEKAAIGKLMLKRFPQLSGIQPTDAGLIKLFRVRPSLISILDYTQGFGHTDLVAISADDITESRGTLRHQWAAKEWA
jgi:general stress protein 26